jgi:hypothetical protein
MQKVLCCLFLAICLNSYPQNNDKFADIGTNAYQLRAGLVVPQPLPLKNIQLPVSHQSKSAFKPVKEISTAAELQVLLQQTRDKYAPFMSRKAPELTSLRSRIALDEFDWRIATAADIATMSSVFAGSGDWKKVRIPHYEPPLGRAVTFYRKNIQIPDSLLRNKKLFICFKGVDYKAQIFLNGNYIGSHEGFFAPFEFDITVQAVAGENTLVVKVENDFPTSTVKDTLSNPVVGDKIYAATGPGYDDPVLGWHHGPAAMGIYQNCYLESREAIHINDVFVRPLPADSKAEAWIEVNNFRQFPEAVKLKLSVYGRNFSDTILENLEYIPSTVIVPGVGDLAKPTDNQQKTLDMGYGVNFLRIPLEMKNFRYWNNETPWLYELQLKLYDKNNRLVDTRTQSFGMRSFSMDTINVPKGKMYLNGEMIRLRGANTMGHEQQCVMRGDWNQLRDDILLAKIANMNYLRFTQRPVQPEVYEYCDMLGLMFQTDLPLFGALRRNKFAEAVKQVEEMERLVRKHPAAIMVSYINERFPNAEGFPQRSFSDISEYWKLFSAFDQAVLLSNPDRVIKAGDGDYDPPSPGLPDSHCYNTWYNGHGLGIGEMYKGYWQPIKPDWYYACGEFGAEGLDPLNVMQKYYPKAWLPKDKADEKNWTANRISMAQTHRFHYMWYNTQLSLQDWITASQDYQAWAVKFVSETFRRDPRMVSFAVHLFIDAWPAGWMKTIMDVDRQPKKAYFAYRNALRPLLVSIRSDRKSFTAGEKTAFELFVSNDLNIASKNYRLKYQLEQNGKVISANEVPATIEANTTVFQGFAGYKTPLVNKRTEYTLRAALFNEKGESISQNTFDFEVFPLEKTNKMPVCIAGCTENKTKELLTEAGLKSTNKLTEVTTLLIDNYEYYFKNQSLINQFVKNGGKVLFVELAPGNYNIAETQLQIAKTTMGQYYFASPVLSHPLLEGFKAFDFNMWYNAENQAISPLLSTLISAKDWTPVVKSGASNWLTDKGEVMAAATFRYGKGEFRISQLMLRNRLTGNPQAGIFLKAMVCK